MCNSSFDAGRRAGRDDTFAIEGADMAGEDTDFVVGYIVGHSEAESIRAASPRIAAFTAGELAYRYRIPLGTVLPYLDFDAESRACVSQSYADAADENDEQISDEA